MWRNANSERQNWPCQTTGMLLLKNGVDLKVEIE